MAANLRVLPQKISDWPPIWRELWAERAGIMEFEGGLRRFTAEYRAEQDVRKLVANEKAAPVRS